MLNERTGIGSDPQGLRIALRRLASRYQVPILITENGLGEYDTLTEDKQIHDTYRIDYLRSHIKRFKRRLRMAFQLLVIVHGVTPIYCRGSTAIRSVMVLSMWIKMKHKRFLRKNRKTVIIGIKSH